jgi:hypothetical protein
MKKRMLPVSALCLGLGALCLALALANALAGDGTVEPASCTFTNYRGEGVKYIDSDAFYKGATLRCTNCQLYASTDTTTVQNLSNVTIQVQVGIETTNHTFTGTMSSTLGLWTCSFTVPTNWDAPNLEVKITDSLTNSYIYPWKIISTKDAME